MTSLLDWCPHYRRLFIRPFFMQWVLIILVIPLVSTVLPFNIMRQRLYYDHVRQPLNEKEPSLLYSVDPD